MNILEMIKRKLKEAEAEGEAEAIQTLFSNQAKIQKALRQLNVRLEALERELGQSTDVKDSK